MQQGLECEIIAFVNSEQNNMPTDLQPKKPIEIFHHNVVTQLTANLKRYYKPKPLPNTNNENQTLIPHNQSEFQYYSTQQISQFLYDVLELQNASIDFIMKDIFDSDKRNIWHIQHIIKTVLDVQFVITVNNSILTMNEQLKNKQNSINFIKINPNQLVQIVHQNCFFLQNTPNSISKQLIHQIVNQINSQNGSKGYILLVQYKTFILSNVIERHNLRKFYPFTANKSKPLTPINKDKYHENSQSIKQVDEESQAMQRSKRNFSVISYRQNELQLDQYSKIKGSQLKQNMSKDFPLAYLGVDKQEIGTSNHELNISVIDKFHQNLWESLLHQLPLQISHEDFITKIKQLIYRKYCHWEQKYKHKFCEKMDKLWPTIKKSEEKESIVIRLLGQYGFKIYHDQILTNTSLRHKDIPYYLSTQQITIILVNSYHSIIGQNYAKQIFQELALHLVNCKGQLPDKSNDEINKLSFKGLLSFFYQLSHPPKY